MVDTLGYLLGASMCSVGWFGYCNERCFKQRSRMLDIVRAHNLSVIAHRQFSDIHDYPSDFVSYSGHLLRLFAFLDPYKVYRVRGWRLGF